MPENSDNVNLGNPCNDRRDLESRNDAKVTNADHPKLQNGGGQAKRGADNLPKDAVAGGEIRDERGRSAWGLTGTGGEEEGEVVMGGSPPVATVVPVAGPATHGNFDSHGETVRDPELEMPGERTSHVDPLSGDTGMHAVGVGIGAAAGGAAAGAAAGFAAGAVAGPLGAAIGAALGTTIGAIGGGYAGKHVAEKVNPTSEDHYWRHMYATREYVPRGSTYEEWEPAYEYGIEMREWLLEKTWEEAEDVIRAGWEASEAGKGMSWQKARPAIQDSWDHLTPEPGEPETTEAEKEEE